MLPLHSPTQSLRTRPAGDYRYGQQSDSPQMGDSDYPHLNWLTTKAGALTPSCANAFSRPPSIHPTGQIAEVGIDLGKREREDAARCRTGGLPAC